MRALCTKYNIMRLSDLDKIPFKDRYPEEWPPIEYFVHESKLSSDVVDGFRKLIEDNAGERAIDKYISANQVILTAILDLNNTGHHAAWVVPKKSIRTHVSTDVPGLIPDFLVGGKNSFGITWYVVELKGAQHKLFKKSNGSLYLSNVANKGLCQVLEYMHFCNKSQSMLREVLKLYDFISAEAFLFIGRENETKNIREKDLKSAFNTINSHLQIRSYDSLLRCCERILGSYNKKKSYN